MLISLLVISLFFCSASHSLANSTGTPYYIAVGAAQIKKMNLFFPPIETHRPLEETLSRSIRNTIINDLTFTGLLKIPEAQPTPTELLLNTSLEINEQRREVTEPKVIHLSGALYRNQGTKIEADQLLFSQNYSVPLTDSKTLAHTFANQIIQSLTGSPGIFLTKIAMSCDLTGKKEIYIMNFDGSEVKQVTRHRSIAFSPTWSPDSTRIAYSLFTRNKANIKNIDLYEFDFPTNTLRLLSNHRGINSGASYSPDGQSIALTMSFRGNPELFILNLKTRSVRQMRKTFGFDVDASWSPDGKQLVFTSGQAGMPMIFSMDLNGSHVQRLTYAGKYNASPSWSPKGDKIVFAGWTEKVFDIFTMNSDGTQMERLTKDQGSNEDPSYSPDGNFIAFSSNRSGQKNIYVMNNNGTFVKRLTFGLGNCVSPKWSNQ